MSAEIYVSPKALAVRVNGEFSLTDRGSLVRELIVLDKALRNSDNSKIAFAMSQELRQEYGTRKEKLCCQLGLPENEEERKKVIQGFTGCLARLHVPYYKIKIR